MREGSETARRRAREGRLTGPWAERRGQIAALIVVPRTAFSILPLRRQRVHTETCFGRPSTFARTRWMFGLNTRLVTLFAWLTFCPAMRCLPQTKHFAIGISSKNPSHPAASGARVGM
jgi:hypothetical protein